MNHELIEGKIILLRGAHVLLDADLADLYGVETRVLNQAVKRNIDRFPEDFMFQISHEKSISLRSQIVILKRSASDADIEDSQRGKHLKHLPYAFTEHGALMLSSVLKSPRAVSTSVQIIRAFVHLRRMIGLDSDLGKMIAEIESRLTGHDDQLKIFFEIVHPLLMVEAENKRRIGFTGP